MKAWAFRPGNFSGLISAGTVLMHLSSKPADFDSSKKYPLLFYVYGEPAGSFRTIGMAEEGLWHQYLAQKQYIIISIDNSGTKNPAGSRLAVFHIPAR